MERVHMSIRRNIVVAIWLLCSFFFVSTTSCDFDGDCLRSEKCCHGTCIDRDASCISGAAIAGIVIGCLVVGGIIISCCVCFFCACGPFQRRSQGTVIRYGGQTQTTTTGTTGFPAANVQGGYGASYPQPAVVHGQANYPQPGAVPYTSAVQGQAAYQQSHGAAGASYPLPSSAPPTYEEANVPPPYNPGYPK